MSLLTDLVAAWELDEASGNAIDSHASLDLTETSGTIGAAAGPGGVGGSRDFEAGDTEYFTRASSSELQLGDIDFTVEAWVQLESTGPNRFVVSKDSISGTGREYNLYYSTAANRFRLEVFRSGPTSVQVSADVLGVPSTATWYQLIAWHDATANEIAICVNAGTATTQASGGSLQSAGSTAFTIGERPALTGAWDGLLAKVRIWKRVLTSGERTSLYNGGSGLAYSAFGGGSGLLIPIVMYHRRQMGAA